MMWDYQQLISLQLTPTTSVRAAQFDKEYRSLVLVVPGARQQLVLTGVDSQKCAGSYHRIHREVRQTKMAVCDMRCWIAVPFAVRYQDRFQLLSRSKKLATVWFMSYQLREIRIGNRFILLFFIHIHIIES